MNYYPQIIQSEIQVSNCQIFKDKVEEELNSQSNQSHLSNTPSDVQKLSCINLKKKLENGTYGEENKKLSDEYGPEKCLDFRNKLLLISSQKDPQISVNQFKKDSCLDLKNKFKDFRYNNFIVSDFDVKQENCINLKNKLSLIKTLDSNSLQITKNEIQNDNCIDLRQKLQNSGKLQRNQIYANKDVPVDNCFDLRNKIQVAAENNDLSQVLVSDLETANCVNLRVKLAKLDFNNELPKFMSNNLEIENCFTPQEKLKISFENSQDSQAIKLYNNLENEKCLELRKKFNLSDKIPEAYVLEQIYKPNCIKLRQKLDLMNLSSDKIYKIITDADDNDCIDLVEKINEGVKDDQELVKRRLLFRRCEQNKEESCDTNCQAKKPIEEIILKLRGGDKSIDFKKKNGISSAIKNFDPNEGIRRF